MKHPGLDAASSPLGLASADRLPLLKRYLEQQADIEEAYGAADCTLIAADFVAFLSGGRIDPGEGLRGTYRTKAQAEAIVAAHGGMAALVGDRLERHGFRRCEAPIDCDIGIVTARVWTAEDRTETLKLPGIRFGAMWAIRTAQGVRVTRLGHHEAWRIA